MRAVIDTNVLASAFIRRQGSCGQVLQHLRDGRYRIIYSQPIILELIEVLSRPRIQQKYHILPEDIAALIHLIRLRGDLVSPLRKIDRCRDTKDNCFLEAAVDGNADVIVSGDSDLLDIKSFEDIPILSVAEFLSRFSA